MCKAILTWPRTPILMLKINNVAKTPVKFTCITPMLLPWKRRSNLLRLSCPKKPYSKPEQVLILTSRKKSTMDDGDTQPGHRRICQDYRTC
eukprot:12427823-Karenia_brevis.AAC.1